MQKYEVIDNFLEKNIFEKIQKEIMGINFPWFINPSVAYEHANDGMYFTHTFLDLFPCSNHLRVLEPFFKKIEIKSIIRIKANLYPSSSNLHEHAPHSDLPYPHKGVILYINNNNGFTKLSCGTKINSIENRVLFFDSSELHNSTTCTDAPSRININMNYF